MDIPKGYRIERGLLWPERDTKCAAVVFDMAEDLKIVLTYVRERDVVVQAGGNCGVWPRALAPLFSTVYTFEPDKTNFGALAFNTVDFPNVIAMNAALGMHRGMVSMFTEQRELHNCGALFVKPGGRVPTLRVDDLALTACDLLYLDIEGFELDALRGASATLDAFGPVVALEDKGLSERYGISKGEAETWLAREHGYKVRQRVHRDVILTRP